MNSWTLEVETLFPWLDRIFDKVVSLADWQRWTTQEEETERTSRRLESDQIDIGFPGTLRVGQYRLAG